MHNYHRNRGPPRCAFKVDIQKAYDTVDWCFLENILVKFGFHAIMVKWFMACVLYASFVLSINGISMVSLKGRDDLFIFSRGDVESARVIMDSLDEFKKTSGLVPSIPKSTAYFCNVLYHTKLAILGILVFSEGELPVKYLGVPLISLRLLNKDCKILVEKAKNRIEDWNNKSLSFAKRLQLCQSVISSMHVYWASVLIIPKGIIHDIQQLIRGFLWCNGEYKRGKAKVAWDVICLPKYEGGLGIRSLEVFNFALMTTHIWNIVSNKESLWVRWIHTYKLRSRTFWDIPEKADMSWGWLKLLQLRDLLIKFLSPRDITREGFHLQNNVADLVSNGAWYWPQSWLHKAPDLGLLMVPYLDESRPDLRQWRDRIGKFLTFSVAKAWEALKPRGVQVDWYQIVWFSHCIPRHAFHLWLVMRNSLTHDRMRQWDVGINTDLNLLRCALCDAQPDSHTHLFFECAFSSQVWYYARDLAGMDLVSPMMHDILLYLQPMANKRTARSVFGRPILAATAYHIWLERNNRVFKKVRRSPEEIHDIIMVTALWLTYFVFPMCAVVREFVDGPRWKPYSPYVWLASSLEGVEKVS
ncbi:putative reverse transcriptase domain, reverse transcriptase zinc-binding domain protein [Tanacetum coccineum]